MIRNYNDFINALMKSGFSGAVGGKDDGVFGLFRYGWGAEEETGVEWHTGNPDTDPWEWRMRVLTERNDISYSKVFFKKAGYIAIFIEYGILEERMKALLSMYGRYNPNEWQISKKVKNIRKLRNDETIVNELITEDVLTNINLWAKARNGYVHGLVENNINDKKVLQNCVEVGYELASDFTNTVKAIRRKIK